MDLESVLIQVANGGQEPLARLIIGVAAVVGIIGVIGYLMSLRKRARHSTKGVEVGRIFAGIIFCVCLITLKAQMNSGGATLGFGDVSFRTRQLCERIYVWHGSRSSQRSAGDC